MDEEKMARLNALLAQPERVVAPTRDIPGLLEEAPDLEELLSGPQSETPDEQ